MSTRVEELLKAGNEASRRVRGLWITFILFAAYLLVAIGSTTHEQLLLESPLILPLLNTPLSLVDFFRIAPAVFLVFHFYLLLHLYLLTRTLHPLNEAIEGDLNLRSRRDHVRAQTDTFLITQLFVGRHITGLPRWFMHFTAWLTIILGPVAVLLAFQIAFLPYHDPVTTWTQRIALLVDLALIWLLWPAVSHPGGRLGGAIGALLARRRRPAGPDARAHDARAVLTGIGKGLLRVVTPLVASLLLICFSLFVATIPGEWIERPVLALPWGVRDAGTPQAVFAPPAVLFQGEPDLVKSKAGSIFSRNLILIDADLVTLDDDALEKVDRTLVLRGRDLRFGRFDRADLRKADLTGAVATGAVMFKSRLNGATLHLAQLQRAFLRSAQMQGADIKGAQMQGADLRLAQLQGADLTKVQLQGANLRGTQMQGADLTLAQLQGTDLTKAQLQGANLIATEIKGAALNQAQLQGANLVAARMEGADLSEAQLQGADLSSAHLQAPTSARQRSGVRCPPTHPLFIWRI